MAWVRLLSGVSLVLPFYHIVSDEHVPHASHLFRFRSIAEFQADVEFFARHFTPVSLQDIVDALDGKRTLPQSCFHLTFDDGLREMHDIVAPILQRAGVPATFFLITAFLDGGGLPHYNTISVLLDRIASEDSSLKLAQVESILPKPTRIHMMIKERLRALSYGDHSIVNSIAQILEIDLDQYVRDMQPHLTSAQVMSMIKRGFSIGSHSIDHTFYAGLPFDGQLSQTQVSMEFLERQFGATPKAFAFPHNDDGISADFFHVVFSQRLLDVSFGTSGLVRHFHPRNLQRVSMENTTAPAEQILSQQFTRAMYWRLRPRKQAGLCLLSVPEL